jgi:hypothetical protein
MIRSKLGSGGFLAQFALKSYARRGAEVRLAELRDEMNAIHAAFPDLRDGRSETGKGAVQRRRRRRGMSAAQRKAVGVRMKKYWAARRVAKK